MARLKASPYESLCGLCVFPHLSVARYAVTLWMSVSEYVRSRSLCGCSGSWTSTFGVSPLTRNERCVPSFSVSETTKSSIRSRTPSTFSPDAGVTVTVVGGRSSRPAVAAARVGAVAERAVHAVLRAPPLDRRGIARRPGREIPPLTLNRHQGDDDQCRARRNRREESCSAGSAGSALYDVIRRQMHDSPRR